MTDQAVEDKPIPAGRSFGRDLTTGSIPRHLIVFSLPMLAGTFLQTAYTFVNRIWVGQYLGKSALTAITVSVPVVFVLAALASGMTMATSILISQHYGAGDRAALRRVVSNSTILFTVLSLVLLVVGEALAPAILRAMNTPPAALDLAVGYLRIYLLSVPLGFGAFAVRSMLQGIGDSRSPLYFLGASVLLTAGLDPVLMFGWLGMPRLGLNGTAWASGIAQLLAVWAMVAWLRRGKNVVAPRWGWRSFHWPTAWTTLRIGLPSSVQQSMVSLGVAFVISRVNHYGENAVSAFGAASSGVDQLAFMPAITFSLAVATLTGQNIGAGRLDRVRSVFRWGCLLSCGVTALVSLLVAGMPRLMMRVFTPEPALVDIGADYLRIVAPCYIFFGVMFASNGVINGAGHTLVTTIVSLVSQWAVRVPMAYLLSAWMGDVRGVWYAVAMSFAASMFVSLGYYLSGRWRRPVVRRYPAPAPSPAAVFGEETGEV